jgi:Uncharacterized conserved protein (DUF2190)
MSDYNPVYTGGAQPFTLTASAAITGGQVVASSGVSTVAPAGATSTTVVGVAAQDAASGARVTVWPISNVIHETTAAGAVTASNTLSTGANGTVSAGTAGTLAAAGQLLGVALTTAADTAKVRWIGR